MKKTSLFFVIVSFAMAFTSCSGNFKTTATLNNELYSLNNAFGLASVSSFKQEIFFNENDSANLERFYKSFLSGFNADFKKTSEGKLQEFNGVSLSMSLNSEIEKGFLFGDSTLVANRKLIGQTALEIIGGKDSVGGFTEKTAQSFYFKINREKRDTIPHELTAEKLDSLNIAYAVLRTSRYARDLDSLKRKDFAKGFKRGLKITEPSERYKTTGSIIGAQGFEGLSKSGLLGDSAITLDAKKLTAGINAGILSDTTVFTEKTANQYIRNVAEARRKAQTEKLYGKNVEAGAKFLAENAQHPDVKVTESGLQYKIIKEGKGAKPKVTDRVTVNYHGTLIDGTVFDSSVERGQPATFGLSQVIVGWTEALQLMTVGSKWTLYIPYQLAYGERAAGSIEPFSTLIFEVELLGIEKPAETQKPVK
jgi:FKBP-type peptidyl-prolyl cis-trans isomerase